MQSRLLNTSATGERTFVIVLGAGDEVVSGMERFAREQSVRAAAFSRLGALARGQLGFYDLDKEEYQPIEVPQQAEVLSSIGNVTESEGEPKIHPHMVLGRRDGSTVGGHLLSGTVHPTLEVTLTESPAHLRREMSRFDIPLIRLDERGE